MLVFSDFLFLQFFNQLGKKKARKRERDKERVCAFVWEKKIHVYA